MTVSARSVVLATLLASCGGATVAEPPPTLAPVATASPSPTRSPAPSATVSAAGPWSFFVEGSSKATVRVREQLARFESPTDAVFEVGGVAGSFTLNPDGTFAPTSAITVQVATIRSDEGQRDNFIRRDPLEVGTYPRAQFVPTAVSGLPLPLPASGDFAFKLTGQMTLHGVSKEVTFDVSATRTGSKLEATATANPSWKFGDFGMRPPSAFVVLSIVDLIRMEFSLVATEVRAT